MLDSPRDRGGVLRRLVPAILGLSGAVVGLLLLALLIAATPPCNEWLRSFAERKANQELSGHFSVAKLQLFGPRLTLLGLELQDPDGRRVARLERLEVRVRLLPLLRHRF